MNLYGVLGLDRNANAEQIRNAYRNLVKKEHPDKGGDAEKFKQIQKAYDVLREDDKKKYYDQTGEIPGEGGGGGGGGGGFPTGGFPFDVGNMFNMFNGGGIPMQRRKRAGKAPPRVTQIPLSLRDYYNGRTFRIQLERQRFCKDCKGEGSTTMKSCAGCNGTGSRVQMIQMGPFMMQNQGPCDMCQGQGKQKGDSCWSCKGNAFMKEEKTLDVRIEPGMASGNTIVFNGESSDTADYTEAGDVVIELQTADETNIWSRKGDDLHASVQVTYSEGLVGCTARLMGHPGFDTAVVFGIPAGVINGETIKIRGYGMPKRGSSMRGDAVLTIQVAKPLPAEKEILLNNRDTMATLFSVVARVKEADDHMAPV